MLKAYFNRVITVNNMGGLRNSDVHGAHAYRRNARKPVSCSLPNGAWVRVNSPNPRPSNLLSSPDAPGITALTAMQTVNRRFTAAFDQMRRHGLRRRAPMLPPLP